MPSVLTPTGLSVANKALRQVSCAVTGATYLDTLTPPMPKALWGIFVYDTGSGNDVCPVTVSGTTATIGKGPSSKDGTIYFWGY